MPEPIRLAKRVVEIAACSRRDAELYIEGGWVSVAGRVVLEPEHRVTDEIVVIDANASAAPIELVTMLYHQPAGVRVAEAPNLPVSPRNHAADDSSNIRVMKRHFTRLQPGLPLGPEASGLTVFTQDWRVLRRIVEYGEAVEHEYNVEVEGEIAPHGLKQLNHGLSFNGRALAPAKVSWQSEARLRFAIHDVVPGQLAHMCQCVGLTVTSIKRLRIGKVSLAKLAVGQWRYLPSGGKF